MLTADGRWRCNIWQGSFPTANTVEDGWPTAAPVRAYEPNGCGLWQTIGNVWEWCDAIFDPLAYQRTAAIPAPPGPSPRVLRGRLVPLSHLLLQPLPELGSIQRHARLFDGQCRIPHGSPMSRERFPAWVYSTGDEPDPRFTLANERTYLAWIRTALALTAGGVALEALGLPLQPGLRLTASGVLIILGMIVPLLAWSTWGTIERAMRNGTPLPGSRVSLPVGVGVSLVAFLIGLSLLMR